MGSRLSKVFMTLKRATTQDCRLMNLMTPLIPLILASFICCKGESVARRDPFFGWRIEVWLCSFFYIAQKSVGAKSQKIVCAPVRVFSNGGSLRRKLLAIPTMMMIEKQGRKRFLDRRCWRTKIELRSLFFHYFRLYFFSL